MDVLGEESLAEATFDEEATPEGLRGLGASPALYLQNFQLQRQQLLLIPMSEGDYREASFLDNRVLKRDTQKLVAGESEIRGALAKGVDARPLHFIFHCGHVGSTLLSRLLDETNVVLPLREPLPLRSLAEGYNALWRKDPPVSEARLNDYLELFLQMASRGYAKTRAVIIKATSSAVTLAPRLFAARPAAKAIYMSLRAEPYLATLMAGENSALDLKGHGLQRQRRLEEVLGESFPPLHLFPLGELAAMSWLTERLSERKLMAEFGSRILSLDFDEMLNDIKGTLERVTRHFELDVESKYFDEIAKSSVLGRYAKAPEHEYSPELRAKLLAEARTAKEADIKKGLAWLDALAVKHRDVAELMQQAPA